MGNSSSYTPGKAGPEKKASERNHPSHTERAYNGEISTAQHNYGDNSRDSDSDDDPSHCKGNTSV